MREEKKRVIPFKIKDIASDIGTKLDEVKTEEIVQRYVQAGLLKFHHRFTPDAELVIAEYIELVRNLKTFPGFDEKMIERQLEKLILELYLRVWRDLTLNTIKSENVLSPSRLGYIIIDNERLILFAEGVSYQLWVDSIFEVETDEQKIPLFRKVEPGVAVFNDFSSIPVILPLSLSSDDVNYKKELDEAGIKYGLREYIERILMEKHLKKLQNLMKKEPIREEIAIQEKDTKHKRFKLF